MKPKFIISIIAVILVAVLAFRFTQKKPAPEETITKKPVKISTQNVSESHRFEKTVTYPGIIKSKQQITLTALTGGTITQLNFDLGKNISQGQRLAIIDSIGSSSEIGKNGLRSSRIRSLELTVNSAKENFRVARNAYNRDETYDKKKNKEIAEIALKNAEADLKGALDEQLVSSPISGTITEKFVSLGDSVSAGQSIATISKLGNLEIQFFVNKEELNYFKIGDEILIKENDSAYSAKITLISPQADEDTKRFLIKAMPVEDKKLIIGSIVTVEFKISQASQSAENLILPLSAITISQNENYVYIVKDNKAEKINIEIIKVFGEMAEIKANLNTQNKIIIEGSKLVKEGDEIDLINN